MRQLGIPNTKHFMNITKIDDVKALWAKLQEMKVRLVAWAQRGWLLLDLDSDMGTNNTSGQGIWRYEPGVCLSFWGASFLIWLLLFASHLHLKESERFQADQEEEYEDSMGNVVSKKTYEDLKRQGLL